MFCGTGMRLSEAFGLLTSEIHFDTATPFVNLVEHPSRRLKTASSQPCNSRLQIRFWLVWAAWPARSCAVLRQVFVERRRYPHSSLRLAAPLPRLGLAEALEFLAMLCWVYIDYVLKFNILKRRLKQIMLTYMDTMKSKDG